MANYKKTSLPRLMIVAALAMAISSHALSSDHNDNEIPFSVAKVFFQLNDTDGDLGFHGKIDGEPWKNVQIEDPNGRRIFNINPRSRLRRQGVTELSFESAEPTFDEVSPAEFFARFPEGEYEIEGESLEGQEMEGMAVITHVLPAPPENLLVSGMATPDDCDEGPLPSIAGPAILSWDPVTQSHPEIGIAGPISVTRYEVAVEVDEPVKLILTVELPPTVTQLEIPAGFLAQGEEFKFQILATDAGGNETSSESCFTVE